MVALRLSLTAKLTVMLAGTLRVKLLTCLQSGGYSTGPVTGIGTDAVTVTLRVTFGARVTFRVRKVQL